MTNTDFISHDMLALVSLAVHLIKQFEKLQNFFAMSQNGSLFLCVIITFCLHQIGNDCDVAAGDLM